MRVLISTIDIDIDNNTTTKHQMGSMCEENKDTNQQSTGSVSADKENAIQYEGRLSSLSVTGRVRYTPLGLSPGCLDSSVQMRWIDPRSTPYPNSIGKTHC